MKLASKPVILRNSVSKMRHRRGCGSETHRYREAVKVHGHSCRYSVTELDSGYAVVYGVDDTWDVLVVPQVLRQVFVFPVVREQNLRSALWRRMPAARVSGLPQGYHLRYELGLRTHPGSCH